MSITNRDIAVKSYFRESLFERMERRRTELGQSRSGYVQNAVAAWLQYGVNHIPASRKCNRPKVATNRPGAPTPMRQ